MLLLIGQFAVLKHSVEHLFHAHEQSCQIFLHCENSGHGLITQVLQLTPPAKNTLFDGQIVTAWSSFLQTSYNARAPPLLSQI